MEKNDDPTIPNYNNESPNIPNNFDSKSYNLSGKIMLCAIVLLFFVIVLMLCLHLYARWYLVQSRRRRNRLRRRSQLVFFTDNPTTTVSVTTSRGLDASVIAKLPLFLYDPETHPHPENAMECAVCLSEFEPGETGRVLPKCNHSFHTECIDMWFHSHSTCPLCRAPVETTFEPQPEVVITVSGEETGSGSGSSHGSVLEDENMNRTGKEICSSSVGLRRKPSFTGVTVEVPTRNEESCDSPSSFRSPMSRMLSFKRMLSREWKGSVVSPSSCGGGGGCSSVDEVNSKVEHGGRGETQ